MTDQPNIIGTVRELQATYEALYPLRELNAGEKGINAQWHSDVCINFPGIAQTLREAISAMEQARYQMDFSPPSLKLENARKPINDFLSRIESPSA